MKPIAIDDFCRFKFLSNVTFSPEGKSACFVVTTADQKKNDYRSCIYVRKDGKIKKLTNGGKERSFQYLDENTLLFPGMREEKADAKEPDLTSRYYKISLDGGEAELAYTFPIPVSKVLPLENGDLLLLGQTLPGFEDLYTGDRKKTAVWKQYAKENADYEEITQVPWWWNGATYTKGAYESLFYYDAKKKALHCLTGLNENITGAELGPDGKTVYYLKTPVEPRLKLDGTASLCRMDLRDDTEIGLVSCSDRFEINGFAIGKSFLLVLASDKKYGLNTDVDFYKLNPENGDISLYKTYGEAIGSSVGTDIRYDRGKALRMDGDVCYFISTRFDSAGLYKLEDGEISAVSDQPGSVECFDVRNGQVLMSALLEMRGQELYLLKAANLTKISSFNDAAVRGRYVAKPEILNVDRGEYEIHGFVLKPMDYDPAKKYPVIFDIHGGPKTVYGPVFYHEMQYWAGKGYFVIFCNPTGSDGRGEFMDIRGKYGTVDYE
ncbi:MAG: S9 family peptidase, partial [Lachnospiraceae bacterium]|nr:S9 family peptidase [Lachnospiraceae bacterium]